MKIEKKDLKHIIVFDKVRITEKTNQIQGLKVFKFNLNINLVWMKFQL